MAGGMCVWRGSGGHAWLEGGHVWLEDVSGWGACMVGGGHVWLEGGMHRIRPDMVNELMVCILLECILVYKYNRIQSCLLRPKLSLSVSHLIKPVPVLV